MDRTNRFGPRTGAWALCLGLIALLLAGCAQSGRKVALANTMEGVIPDGYVIGPEDVLEVSVWQNADVSRVVKVRPDGKISLPLVHDILAAGRTPEGLRDAIEKALKPYMDIPEVTVIVQEINSWRIYVQGEVQRPGVYPIRTRTTLTQAITLAGGFTEFAKKGRIQVVRTRGGKRENIPVDYNRILKGEQGAQDIFLEPGDTIIVP